MKIKKISVKLRCERAIEVIVKALSERECAREDSNLQGVAPTSTSSWRVCQFRHARVYSFRTHDASNEFILPSTCEVSTGDWHSTTIRAYFNLRCIKSAHTPSHIRCNEYSPGASVENYSQNQLNAFDIESQLSNLKVSENHSQYVFRVEQSYGC